MSYLSCKDTVRQTTTDVPLKKALISIGRISGNDIVLDDPTIGATHANLLRGGKDITINAGRQGRDLRERVASSVRTTPLGRSHLDRSIPSLSSRTAHRRRRA